MKHGWNGDRAIGLVLGVAVSLLFAAGIMQRSPLHFIFALGLLATGIFLPSTGKDNKG